MIVPSPRVLAHAVAGSQSLFARLYGVKWHAQMLHSWVKGLGLRESARIVEVGTAGSDLAAWLMDSGREPSGVDLSSGAVAAATKRFPQASYVVADALDLPFDTDGADAVLGASLINLVPDRVAAFAEFVRATVAGLANVKMGTELGGMAATVTGTVAT